MIRQYVIAATVSWFCWHHQKILLGFDSVCQNLHPPHSVRVESVIIYELFMQVGAQFKHVLLKSIHSPQQVVHYKLYCVPTFFLLNNVLDSGYFQAFLKHTKTWCLLSWDQNTWVCFFTIFMLLKGLSLKGKIVLECCPNKYLKLLLSPNKKNKVRKNMRNSKLPQKHMMNWQ